MDVDKHPVGGKAAKVSKRASTEAEPQPESTPSVNEEEQAPVEYVAERDEEDGSVEEEESAHGGDEDEEDVEEEDSEDLDNDPDFEDVDSLGGSSQSSVRGRSRSRSSSRRPASRQETPKQSQSQPQVQHQSIVIPSVMARGRSSSTTAILSPTQSTLIRQPKVLLTKHISASATSVTIPPPAQSAPPAPQSSESPARKSHPRPGPASRTQKPAGIVSGGRKSVSSKVPNNPPGSSSSQVAAPASTAVAPGRIAPLSIKKLMNAEGKQVQKVSLKIPPKKE